MALKSYHLLIGVLLLLMGASHVQAQTAKDILLKNVGTLPMPPVPECISFFYTTNERPEIIATTKWDGAPDVWMPVIIVSTVDKGKVLALNSPEYLKPIMLQNRDVAQLLINTLTWAGNGKKSLSVALTTKADNKALRDLLAGNGASAYIIKDFDFKSKPDVLILTEEVVNPLRQKRIETFVRSGGTLIFASPYNEIRNKRDSTKKEDVSLLSINKVLTKAGIFSMYTFAKQPANNKVLRTDSVPDYMHINTILPRLLLQQKSDRDDFIDYAFVTPMLELVGENNSIDAPIFKHLKQYFKVPDVLPVPTVAKPVINNTPELKIATKIAYMLYTKQQDFDKHPTAKAPGYENFPGAVPAGAARVTQTVTIPVMVGTQGLPDMPSVYFRPHTTGLYVPAGEKVTVTISKANIKQHLKAQIGVHDDNVTHLDEFKRVPVDMTKVVDLDKEKIEIYSPYGGLLLISIADTSKLKTLKITVSGAVKAPYFKLSETNEQDWIKTIRNNPAPWAELATDKIVFTVPSSYVRYLNNPVKLMQFWDEVMDADADLAIVSRKRVHQERIIVDVSVAYGGLFTVPYKIVAPDEESSRQMLDEVYMRSKGLWGQFHELGHRHQFFDLNFPGTTEVTVNLFTMYVFDKVLHKGLYNHEGMEDMTKVVKVIKDYLADNPTYEKWSNDPFLALSMYIQIIDAFGWDAIKAANTVYRNLPLTQYSKTDQDKRDLWFTTICKATNSNMSRFFDVWKIEVSAAAKKQVAGYKEWFPKVLEN
ncbi:MAG: hypothetical protein JWQ34_1956 [Mucilaginibacter sp.]|uniref:M60 family metallopeptidase n=1 Tax=Mucilaginibacter sp. TaxID=1882438 RepID=UPI002611E8F0|nr:M60 family metallopeptidase [Mucilaginibacter sp.]MDB5003731.1 hypothetical protein [Mucilaginibacter sp.]